ncbi:prolyl aminopeptidase [Pleomorphomonas carboxyditropha]|uniref:Proline iminopeptidase n=1 Tax=Pleomorphomonas carboxyditropha TaxID=2023338 RepID=A0A2G9WRF3_9HYPH|nr:prolyl aminopeptidase [Pleomorphomonas carboxyditropha]PIO97291.1 prolyl aminopeptidase [Pleomorphomonas carboxyditropha]
MSEDLYPPIEPFESGLLQVAHGNRIYWEVSGNPKGKPALYLHGGPGSGLGSGSYRQRFDPLKYLIVGIDQRGCGRSRPLAAEAIDELHTNTTQALIEDIEAVRTRLGIGAWLISGVSWGTTLALAYAEEHPDKISELVLVAVTTTSRDEVDWITDGVGRIFPEAWQRFERDSGRRPGERVVEAYARRLATSDVEDRLRAARAWNDWETAHISLDPNWVPIDQRFDDERGLVFATLVTHYWANDGFLRDGKEILKRMPVIAHIPAVLIHGRRDISGPAITPWALHNHWPASRLVIVESEGHGGPQSFREMRLALDAFAGQPDGE